MRYTGRLDVMLAEIAPGATIAGVFTRSATRSAPVLWCEEKLAALRAGGAATAASPSWSTPATPTPSPAAPAARRSRRRVAADRDGARRAGGPCLRRLDRGDRRAAAGRAHRRGAGRPARRPGRGRRRAGGAGDHDHRHLPQGGGGADRARRRAGDDHRLRQGLGDDRARTWRRCWSSSSPTPRSRRGCCRRWSRGPATRPSTASPSTATPRPRTRCCMAATGQGADARRSPTRTTARSPAFEAALAGVMRDLAHQVVRDGEGATKFVEVRVTGAESAGGRAQGRRSRSPTRRWSRPRSPARIRTGAGSSWRSASPARRPTATG